MTTLVKAFVELKKKIDTEITFLSTYPKVLAKGDWTGTELGKKLEQVETLYKKVDWKKISLAPIEKVPFPKSLLPAVGEAKGEADKMPALVKAVQAAEEEAKKLETLHKKTPKAPLSSPMLDEKVAEILEANGKLKIFVSNSAPAATVEALQKDHARRSSPPFEAVLADDKILKGFEAHLKKEFNVEPLTFLLKYNAAKAIKDQKKQKDELKSLFDEYVKVGSDKEVNVGKGEAEAVRTEGAKGNFVLKDWDSLSSKVWNQLTLDSWPRYVATLK